MALDVEEGVLYVLGRYIDHTRTVPIPVSIVPRIVTTSHTVCVCVCMCVCVSTYSAIFSAMP